MTLSTLLVEIVRRGIALEIRGDRVLYEAPSDAMTSDLLAALKAHKAALTNVPVEAGRLAREVWALVLEEVSGHWDQVAAASRAQGQNPPWLDEGTDLELQATVREAILAADLPAALDAIGRWRMAWLELLGDPASQPSSPAPTEVDPRPACGWIEIDSTILGEHVVVALTEDALPDAKAAHPDLVVYAPIEIERLYGIKDPILLRMVHTTKRELDAWVDDPRKADSILAEYGETRPPRNPTVHQMFSEARKRFVDWEVEENCLTTWLLKHTPNVAALWPDAPPTASWLDWRQHVGREHMEILDKAFETVAGTTITHKKGSAHA